MHAHLAHTFFQMRSKATSGNRASTIHTIKHLLGNGGVSLIEHIHSILAAILSSSSIDIAGRNPVCTSASFIFLFVP